MLVVTYDAPCRDKIFIVMLSPPDPPGGLLAVLNHTLSTPPELLPHDVFITVFIIHFQMFPLFLLLPALSLQLRSSITDGRQEMDDIM